MLIYFKVKNYRSIDNEMVLDMRPNKGSRLNTHKANPIQGVSVLCSALIFGANASGKSNIIKAIQLGQAILLRGTDRCYQRLYDPFRLGSLESKLSPTKFEYAIQTNGKNYRYGFTFDANHIYSEWLYEFNRRTEKLIFSRTTENGETVYNLDNIKKLNKVQKQKDFLDFIAMSTPENQLHLREYYSRNLDNSLDNITPIMDVVNWFVNTLEVLNSDKKLSTNWVQQLIGTDKVRDIYCKILRTYDIGIHDIEFVNVKFDDIKLPSELKSNIIKNLEKKADTQKKETGEEVDKKKSGIIVSNRTNIYMFRLNEESELISSKLQIEHKVKIDEVERIEPFDPSDESEGTNYLFTVIPIILKMYLSDKVFIFDELGHSLHSLLTIRLVRDFYDACCSSGSQFVCTTHEIGLLDQELVRKDEVKFVTKDDNAASCIKNLSSFPLRLDKNLRDSYLHDDFKVLPHVSKKLLDIDIE